jgi:hypothetical protein
MCKWVKSGANRIDPCMRKRIERLNEMIRGKTIASCCGHGRYPMTIVVRGNYYGYNLTWEWFSGTPLKNKKKFYKRDPDGYFFIPEISKPKSRIFKEIMP